MWKQKNVQLNVPENLEVNFVFTFVIYLSVEDLMQGIDLMLLFHEQNETLKTKF